MANSEFTSRMSVEPFKDISVSLLTFFISIHCHNYKIFRCLRRKVLSLFWAWYFLFRWNEIHCFHKFIKSMPYSLSRSRIVRLYEDVTIGLNFPAHHDEWWPLPVKGWKIQICTYLQPLNMEGSLSCHTFCNRRPRFSRSLSNVVPCM